MTRDPLRSTAAPPPVSERGAPDAPATTPVATGADLRVAVFSDAIPGRNGVGTYYDDLVRHLEGRVERIRLVAPPRGDEARRGIGLPMPGDPTQRLYLPPVRRIWREVGELSPDVIVSATPGMYGFLGLVMSVRLGSAFCVAHHTQLDELINLYWNRIMGPFSRWVLGLWDRFMFRCSGAVLVHNEGLLEKARRSGAREVRLVGTPTPGAFLDTPLPPPPDGLSSVAFVGRLAPEKELEQILEAARRFPELTFTLAGDGPLRDEVAGWARELENVEFLGWVGRGRVLEILDRSDLLVLPSSYETFGSVVLEAMARRTLALVSPTCGITRWPELARGLLIMEPGERLADALGRTRALGPEERNRVAEAGRAASSEINRRTVDHWLRVLHELRPDGRPG